MSTPTKFAARSRLGSDVPPSPYSPGKLSHSLSNEDGAEKKARRCVFYVQKQTLFFSFFSSSSFPSRSSRPPKRPSVLQRHPRRRPFSRHSHICCVMLSRHSEKEEEIAKKKEICTNCCLFKSTLIAPFAELRMFGRSFRGESFRICTAALKYAHDIAPSHLFFPFSPSSC